MRPARAEQEHPLRCRRWPGHPDAGAVVAAAILPMERRIPGASLTSGHQSGSSSTEDPEISIDYQQATEYRSLRDPPMKQGTKPKSIESVYLSSIYQYALVSLSVYLPIRLDSTDLPALVWEVA